MIQCYSQIFYLLIAVYLCLYYYQTLFKLLSRYSYADYYYVILFFRHLIFNSILLFYNLIFSSDVYRIVFKYQELYKLIMLRYEKVFSKKLSQKINYENLERYFIFSNGIHWNYLHQRQRKLFLLRMYLWIEPQILFTIENDIFIFYALWW